MSDHTEQIVEALAHAKAARRVGAKDTADVCDRLADALEQTVKERDAAVREMHARELHHFEEEQRAEKAEAERDALADRIERAKATRRTSTISSAEMVYEMYRILSEGESS